MSQQCHRSGWLPVASHAEARIEIYKVPGPHNRLQVASHAEARIEILTKAPTDGAVWLPLMQRRELKYIQATQYRLRSCCLSCRGEN